MIRTVGAGAVWLMAQIAGAQEVPARDDAARVNAETEARVAAQSASIRRSQEDYARAQAAFAQAQAAYEAARKQNDADRAAAADSAAAYQRDLAGWKAEVAAVKARNERRGRPADAPQDEVTVVAPAPMASKRVCIVEAETGSIIPRRTCRTAAETAEYRKAGEVQVQAIRDDMNGGTGHQPG